MYAVVRTGGKQYRVQEGRTVKIERIAGEPGETVELGDVLLMADGDDVTVGSPTIDGARIVGRIAEQGRERKIVVFRYKAKTRSRKKTGHRQHFTRVMVDDILGAGQEPKPKAAKEAAAAAPEAEAPTKGRRGRRGTATAAAPEVSAPAEAAPAEASATDAATAAPEAAPAAEEKPKRGRKKAE